MRYRGRLNAVVSKTPELKNEIHHSTLDSCTEQEWRSLCFHLYGKSDYALTKSYQNLKEVKKYVLRRTLEY